MFKEYTQYDGMGLASLVNKGEVTPGELLEAALARVAEKNPQINAVNHQFEALAKQQMDRLPKGPFTGLPFLLKDLQAVCKDVPVTMGSRAIHFIPDYDSLMVHRIKKTGVNIFGKTNTPEFGLIITTEPKAYGPTHNPHKLGYSSGGSSGGSAAAVVSGMVPIASAGDGGGSIRFPASWCGVFGLKPSRGRNPLGPDVGEGWDGAISDHVLTRSVRDSAMMLDCIAGHELGAPYDIDQTSVGSFYHASRQDPKPLRIAVSKRPLVDTIVDPEVLAALDKTVQQLEGLGHHVFEAEPMIDTNKAWRAFFVVVCSHTAALKRRVRRDFGAKAASLLEPSTHNVAMLGESLSAADLVMAKEEWHRIQYAMGQLLSQCDVMLSPTVPTPAVKHGVLPPSKLDEGLMNLISPFKIGRWLFKLGLIDQFALPVFEKMAFTIMGNMTGLPGMSVPLHQSSQGLPIGMQFTGRMCDEKTLFALAGQLERAGMFQPCLLD